MLIHFCHNNFDSEKQRIPTSCFQFVFFFLTKTHSTVSLCAHGEWCALVQMHVDRVWHKYASRVVPRLRSVTNRVLIMNENNTRASISKHTFLSVKPSGSTTLAAEVCGKISRSYIRTNITPIITGEFVRLFVSHSIALTSLIIQVTPVRLHFC